MRRLGFTHAVSRTSARPGTRNPRHQRANRPGKTCPPSRYDTGILQTEYLRHFVSVLHGEHACAKRRRERRQPGQPARSHQQLNARRR